VKISWCPVEDGCRGGFCPRALEKRGQNVMALVKPVEAGRRPADVIQLFTVDLCKARPKTADGVERLAPVNVEYEIHTVVDRDGKQYWVALYSGVADLDTILAGQPPWDEVQANEQLTIQLAILREDRIRDRFAGSEPRDRRVW
jgi:hypothetical protein